MTETLYFAYRQKSVSFRKGDTVSPSSNDHHNIAPSILMIEMRVRILADKNPLRSPLASTAMHIDRSKTTGAVTDGVSICSSYSAG